MAKKAKEDVLNLDNILFKCRDILRQAKKRFRSLMIPYAVFAVLFLLLQMIPTLDNGPKLNGEFIPRWPPNSPDLSPIKLIWSITKGMLNIFSPTSLEELKEAVEELIEK